MTPGEAPDSEEEKKAKEDYDKWRASASRFPDRIRSRLALGILRPRWPAGTEKVLYCHGLFVDTIHRIATLRVVNIL